MTEPAAPTEPMHDDLIDVCESFDPPTITTTTATTATTTPDDTPDHPEPQTP